MLGEGGREAAAEVRSVLDAHRRTWADEAAHGPSAGADA